MTDTIMQPDVDVGAATAPVRNPYTGEIIASVPIVRGHRHRQCHAAGQVTAPYGEPLVAIVYRTGESIRLGRGC